MRLQDTHVGIDAVEELYASMQAQTSPAEIEPRMERLQETYNAAAATWQAIPEDVAVAWLLASHELFVRERMVYLVSDIHGDLCRCCPEIVAMQRREEEKNLPENITWVDWARNTSMLMQRGLAYDAYARGRLADVLAQRRTHVAQWTVHRTAATSLKGRTSQQAFLRYLELSQNGRAKTVKDMELSVSGLESAFRLCSPATRIALCVLFSQWQTHQDSVQKYRQQLQEAYVLLRRETGKQPSIQAVQGTLHVFIDRRDMARQHVAAHNS